MIYLKQIFFQMLIIKKEIGHDEWVNEISSYIWAPENDKLCIRIEVIPQQWLCWIY